MATIPASENVFPIVRFDEVAAPSTPPTGEVHLYAKADGLLYWKDDAGTEYAINTGITPDLAGHLADTSDAHDASAISVLDTGAHFTATDVEAALAELFAAIGAGGIPITIIDAAGDLIVGTAADTAARLAIGATNGMALRRVAGALAWDLPPGHEFDYAQWTSNVNVTATAEASATTVVTGSAVTYDGSTVVMVEFFTQNAIPAGGSIAFWLFDGSSSIGRICVETNAGSNAVHAARRLTPSAASHTYSVRGTVTSGTGTAGAGPGGAGASVPGFMRITKV